MSNLKEIEKMLAARGYKLTQNRRLLLQGIVETDDWASAQELFQYVFARNKKVNFSTIYRNLDALTEMGLLCRVDRNTIHYYALNHEKGHHHHLICKSCNKVLTLDFCPLNSLEPQHLQSFSDIECKFDVYGYCQDCQSHNLSDQPSIDCSQNHETIMPVTKRTKGRK